MRWIVFVAPPNFVWIEGIGDVMNSMFLAHSIHCDGTNSSVFGFICHDHPDLGVYKPEHISDCDSIFTSNAKDSGIQSPLLAYPNPVKDQLYLESEEFDSWTADFVHPSGQRIHSTQVLLNSLQVPDSIPPGIYIVRLSDKYGNQKLLKIIKQ